MKITDEMAMLACRKYYNSGNPVYPPEFEAMRAALEAVVSMLVPEGWAIVPIIMTDAMDKAGWPADTAQEGWELAIAAAPSPVSVEVKDGK